MQSPKSEDIEMSDASPDLVVVGAGIFGLSVARAARLRGMSVRVLEAEHVGWGASGGIVGALTPHAPSRWRPMMAFQFNALLALPQYIEALEDEAGAVTGYRKSGRLTPLRSEKMRASAERDAEVAPEHWGEHACFEVLDNVPESARAWIRPEAAPFGLARDSISARIDPRAYLTALSRSLSGEISTDSQVLTVDPKAVSASTKGGIVSGSAIVLTAGWQVWELLPPAWSRLEGQPVKGQAALFRADARDLPVIYQDGLYIVPHDNGHVAVGSTSEKVFDAPYETDEKLDEVVARARAMCPALEDAPLVERWAGLRPKPPGREPVVGPVSEDGRIWIAAGGFKISFGIAHAVADAVVAGIAGEVPNLAIPESFDPSRIEAR